MPQMTDTINAKPREGQGKGTAHKLRAAGHAPAIAYGPGTAPRHLAIEPKAFLLQRTQFGSSHIFDVAVEGGKPFKALIREVQQNPLTDELLHVDFYALDMSKPIRVDVPLELEGKPVGIIEGGILQQIARRVTIECLPVAIPKKLTADVSSLNIGQSAHMSNIALPEGVKFIAKGDEAIAVVVKIEEEVVAAPVAAEGVPVEGAAAAAAPAEGAEGAAAAPAAGAAAAPAEAAAKGKGAKGGGEKGGRGK